ncbi:unnamed protein product, partial [marine sediment metagenome]
MWENTMTDRADASNEYDLFISYAHADNEGRYDGWVTALTEAIQREHAEFVPASGALRIFFDTAEIRNMDDWEARILLGLRQSKLLVAVLSPAYFASDYCRQEWAGYRDLETQRGLLGEGIAGAYVVEHPEFSAANQDHQDEWLADLKRRQYTDLQEWWPQGREALEQVEVR